MLICIAVISFVGVIIFGIISFSQVGLTLTSVICILSLATIIFIMRFAKRVEQQETEIEIADGCEFRLKVLGNFAFWSNGEKTIQMIPVYSIAICEPATNKPIVTCVEQTYYYPSWAKIVCDFGLFGDYEEETVITYCVRVPKEEIEYLD